PSTFGRTLGPPAVPDSLHAPPPTPCVRCNHFCKSPSLWERACALGARWLAPGHYARVQRAPGGRAELWAGVDAAKDQSYFLFAIEPAVLARVLFPIGRLTKAEGRARARALELPVAEKPESQEVCFAPHGAYASFVAPYTR